MKLIYIDETGDPNGRPSLGSSKEYALGVVVVDSTQWNGALDHLKLLRFKIRAMHRIGATKEIKASALVHSDSDLKGLHLSGKQKKQIYRLHFKAIRELRLQVFAVWVDKRGLETDAQFKSVREKAWEMLLQRLERSFRDHEVMIFHDQGDDRFVRNYLRKSRRHLTAGVVGGSAGIRVDFANLVEDGIPKVSHDSLFIQLADLVAYSAARRQIAGGVRATRVCPPELWDELGTALMHSVNSVARGKDPARPVAIVFES